MDQEEDIRLRLNSLIVRVGDKTASGVENDIKGLADALAADVGKFSKQITEMVVKCAKNLPVKTPVYATLVGLLNVKAPQFASDVVALAASELQKALDECDFRSIKLLVRFFGELHNASVIKAQTFLDMLNELMSVSDDMNSPRARTEFFIYVVLVALPWAGKELASYNPPRDARGGGTLKAALSRIEGFMASRGDGSGSCSAALVVHEEELEEGARRKDYLDEVWDRVQYMKNERWEVKTTMQPYSFPHCASQLSLCEHHAPPRAISVPPHKPGTIYPSLPSMFRAFDDEMDAEAEITPVDRLVVEEYIRDMLFFFEGDHKLCTRLLLTLPVKQRIEHILVETIFAEMFRLPRSDFPLVYYGVILGDLCKSHPEGIPEMLIYTVDSIFQKVDVMDAECVDRFAEWFAYHLSNWLYKWSWNEWSEVLAMEPTAPKRAFVSAVLERCMRLAYHERIKMAIPDEFHALMPPEPLPNFALASEATAEAAEVEMSKALQQRLREKAAPADVATWIENAATDLGGRDRARNVFLETVLNVGSKSLSHILNLTERYTRVLLDIANSHEERLVMIRAIARFWRNSPQMIIILLDKLMTYRIIDGRTIVDWVLSEENDINFTKIFPWEVLRNVINKSVAVKLQTQKDLATAEKALTDAVDKGRDTIAADEQLVQQTQLMLEQRSREQQAIFVALFDKCLAAVARLIGGEEEVLTPPVRRLMQHIKEIGRKHYPDMEDETKEKIQTRFDEDRVDPRALAVFKAFRSCYE